MVCIAHSTSTDARIVCSVHSSCKVHIVSSLNALGLKKKSRLSIFLLLQIINSSQTSGYVLPSAFPVGRVELLNSSGIETVSQSVCCSGVHAVPSA